MGCGTRQFIRLALLLLCFCGFASYGFTQEVKEPNAAGSFYPDGPEELSRMVDNFLALADPEPMPGEIFALIAPHAGYGYSGSTAAYGYKPIKNKPYKTVVVIGTSHQYGFCGASVYPEGIFRTPLGDLEIDKEFTQKLLDQDQDITFAPEAFSREHSVEVQLPFLQKTLTDFKIVPIVMGDCPFYICQKLAQLLREAIGERKDVLIIVSTDMYHGYDHEACEKTDALTLSAMRNMDAEGLYHGLRSGEMQLCGGFGVVSTLILAKELGHDKLDVLHYTNSALVTGNKNKGTWTVGYASCAIDQDKKGGKAMLNKTERERLLEIARKSIETYLATGRKLELSEAGPLLSREMGAFVTLRENQELRGCIGNLAGKQPLYLAVRDMAVESATGDPRFPAVNPGELKNIDIEISVLSPLEMVSSSEEIELGKHGVLVKKGLHSGVFLPQVAEETGWTKEEFLSNLCSHKAGLPADAWKDKDTEIYVFEAEVFSEHDY